MDIFDTSKYEIERRINELEKKVSELEKKVEDSEKNQVYWPPFTAPAPSWLSDNNQCSVCGLEFKGAMGYVCTNSNCPTRITC